MPWTAALVTAGSYVDLTGFDPVIARVTDGEEVDPSEFQMATQGWWPSDPVTLTTITDGQGNDQQWLVVQPGQFERNSAPGAATVTGTERLWSDLTVKLIKRPANADPNDTVGPTVHSVTLSNDGTTWTAVVDAEDASGIGSIDVTEIGAGDANDHDFPISSTDTNPYSVHFPVSGSQTQDVSMLIAVTDNAGHTTTVTAKGSLWSASAHAITAGASAGGSISPVGGVIVNDGGDQTFAITPAAHHHVVDVTVDGTSRGAIASYTFSGVTADHAITATFAIDQENLNVTTAGQGNVAVSPSQPTYDYGSTVTLTATPASGWQFDHWGGDASGSASPLTVTMNSDRKVSATFVPSGSAFQVTTLAGSVGTAGSADGTGSAAQFNWPSGVCCDAVGNVYVGDDWNNTVRKITPDGVVTTLAGSAAGIAGSTDGTGSTARFDHPMGVVCDPAGDVFVADSWNYVIREITPGGVVTTYAGSAGNPGSADGSLTTARFDHPTDLAIDGVGNLYVTDYYNSTIRKITPGGVVSTLAGSAGQTGTADGTGSQARFNNPSGLACDGAGNVYVADTYNQTIRKITPGGVVSTLAGSPGAQGSTDGTGGAALFYQPAGVACDAAGNVYVADYDNNTIREITPAGVVTTVAGSAGVTGSTDGTGSAASFNLTRAIACDAVGNLYVADVGNSTIRKASCPATVGGWLRVVQGAHGTISLDGQTGAAPAAVPVQHGHSQAFAIIPDAYYRTSDVEVDGGSESRIAGYGFNDVVQDHTIAATFSSVVVGSEAGSLGPGSSDGVGPGAEFRYPYAVACEQGYVYVADSANDTIRKVTPSGVVTTVAGTAGSPGSADGNGGAASFDFPEGIACDSAGNIYVADSLNDTIRRISSGGDVTTIAGTPGVAGSADGTGPAASFSEPCGLACDSAGDIYVADRKNFTIRKVTPSGVVTTLAGSPGAYGCSDGVGSSATFAYPQAVACDSAGNVYVADYDYSIIRKITPSGVVTTIAGSAGHPGFADGVGTAAQFDGPCGIACDSYDNLYVADTLGDEVRMITPTGVVVTLAGSGGVAGSTDGNGATARFKYPRGIACTNAGIVFIADTNNQMIRVLGP